MPPPHCQALIMCHFAVFRRDFGPGPSHAIDPAITHRGHDGTPHYSLSSRHKELTPFNTPGPGTYAPETSPSCFQGEKQLPAYTMSARTRYRKSKWPLLQLPCTVKFLLYLLTCRRCQSFPRLLHPTSHDRSTYPQSNLFCLLLHARTYLNREF